MLVFKNLLAVAALACAIVTAADHETSCAPAATVTVTIKECVTSVVPVAPGHSYSPPPAVTSPELPPAPPVSSGGVAPPAPPASTIESTASPLSSNPVELTASTPVTETPTGSVSETTVAPSSSAAETAPPASSSTPAQVSTNAAPLATPLVAGLGSFVAAMVVLV